MKKVAVILVFGIIIGLLPGIIFHYSYLGVLDSTATNGGDCVKQYPFTDHDADCDTVDSSADAMKALDSNLEDSTAKYVSNGEAKRVSVYVRDLVTKQWAASNENDTYAPASLMKVPLMIAYYKFAQIQPSILNQKLVYVPAAQDGDDIQDIESGALMVTGQQYTVEQLIEAMIENSDNNAADLLLKKIDPQFLDGVFVDLGIRIPRNTKEYDFVTVKTYSSMLRQLYNASYLDREYSNKALEIMSKSQFKGIALQIPSGTPVSQKFGEREVDSASGTAQTRELHDCGIVYKGPHPYVICVFTEGSDFTQLESILNDLSKIAYDAL